MLARTNLTPQQKLAFLSRQAKLRDMKRALHLTTASLLEANRDALVEGSSDPGVLEVALAELVSELKRKGR